MSTAAAASADEVRIVVVDDQPDAADMLAIVLELDGYTVRVAHDGQAALQLIESFDPHAVLLDVHMPGLDGNELSRRLRDRHGDDVVLVAITGAAETDRRVADTFARVDHFLQKPVDAAQLRRVLPPLG